MLAAWALLDATLVRWGFLERVVPALLGPVNPHGRAVLYWAIGGRRVLESALFFGYWRARGWSLADLGLTGTSSGRGLRAGVAWSAALGLLVLALEALSRRFGTSFLRAVAGPGANPGDRTALLVVGGFLGPLLEELLFRGVLYGGYRKRLGPLPSVAFAAAVFALAHGLGMVPVVQAAGGLLFCAAYEIAGSLWAPLLIHVLGNLAIFSAAILLR